MGPTFGDILADFQGVFAILGTMSMPAGDLAAPGGACFSKLRHPVESMRLLICAGPTDQPG